MLPHVRLIADHFMVIGDAPTSNLDTGIGTRSRTEKLDLQAQFKITVFFCGAQELVANDSPVHGTAHYGAVFYSKPIEIPFPRGQCLAVEEGHPAGRSLFFRGIADVVGHEEFAMTHVKTTVRNARMGPQLVLPLGDTERTDHIEAVR